MGTARFIGMGDSQRKAANEKNGTPKSNYKASHSEKKQAAKDYSAANNSNSDEVKYKVAVEAAKNNLKDQPDVDERELKAEIDNELKHLGASKSGAAIRGESPFSQALEGARNFIDDATLAVGNGVDWLADNTVGNFIGLFDKDLSNVAKNFMDGKDLQAIVDVASDVGLAALGPAGWAAMLGKNAIQQSDNIIEGITGKDSTTMEDVNSPAKLAEGLGGLALSAVPVAGKIKNMAGFLKTVPKASEGAEATTKAIVKGVDPEAVAKQQADNMVKQFSQAYTKPLRPSKIDGWVAEQMAAQKAAQKAANPTVVSNATNNIKDKASSINNALYDKFPRIAPKILPKAKGLAKGAVATAAGAPLTMFNVAPSYANDGEALTADETQPSTLAAVFAPLLSMYKRQNGSGPISPTGRRSFPGALAVAAANAINGSAKAKDRAYEHSPEEGMSDQDVMEYLKVR